MMNKSLKASNVKSIVHDLLSFLKDNEKDLKERNRVITGDTYYWIEQDFDFVCDYLSEYEKNVLPQIEFRKPKGNICIVLSYNEPFILSIIPILNCLVAGNALTVKPSRRSEGFVEEVWLDSGISKNHSLPVKVEYWERDVLYRNLVNFNTLVFFGSYVNAKGLSGECGKHYVEFLPEIEGADVRVIGPGDAFSSNRKGEMLQTLDEAFSHAGQTCQRIHGVFVHSGEYQNYINELNKVFLSDFDIRKHVNRRMRFNQSYIGELRDDIKKSNPDDVWFSGKGDVTCIICNPDFSSEIMQKAYFLPTLWVSPYDNEEHLISLLNSRRFHLGLSVFSDSDDFVKRVVNGTNYARYTINTPHVKIRSYEGWGANWPSGFRGYQQWLDCFSNPYIVINS